MARVKTFKKFCLDRGLGEKTGDSLNLYNQYLAGVKEDLSAINEMHMQGNMPPAVFG